MANTSYQFPGTLSDDASVGLVAWSSPSDAASSNNVYTTATLPPGRITHYLTATNFGFAIPSGSTITGILVDIERKASTDAGGNIIVDSELFLIKGGTISGTDHAIGGAHGTTDSIITYGGSSDLWGLSFSVSDINASNFGVAYSAANAAVGLNISQVDAISVQIYYTPPVTINPLLTIGD